MRQRMTTATVPIHRKHRALIHIAIAPVTRRTCLHLHRRLQWEDTVEKGQHNLLCGITTRSIVSYSHAASMRLLFVLIT